ncbi:hypothetical protein FB567DRAFT_48376 [Paraphoma chrysanthemicola]|uniref:Uncharacterized protein n=1 Tax=Paraphoma chrysanthemicola TaxID=798071 RepID=A0A8K0RLM1_9PLEO|nr:hypothetical protein FB567DRAFT_48376 [Paraphoma chrysanthemicola]
MEYTQSTDLTTSDVSSRLLHRFYEPLGLLSALGQARGEHTHTTPPSLGHVDSLTHEQLRRQFLNELAFLCDYKKGGDSCTAIALGQNPQGYVFWVAANKCPERLIIPFLESLLEMLKRADGTRDSQLLIREVSGISITFARERLMTYALHLLSKLEKLKGFPACTSEPISGFIAIWENRLENLDGDDLYSLVEYAYTSRHSDFMRQLATLADEQRYKASGDSLQATCASVRHLIGRLGLHARSARALASFMHRMMPIMESYSVRAVHIPVEGKGRPAPRKATNLDGALNRMLPQDTPDREVYQPALARLDKLFNISERFLSDYSDSKHRTRVHAEVQVLHHFDEHDEEFAGGDKYIACSKPACFCCRLYFRHHPGGFLEPHSHQKIYLNWQPPLMKSARPGKEHQLRDILNLMTKDIRKDALDQLRKQAAPRGYHPDSITGISLSTLAMPGLDAISIAAHDEREKDALVDADSEYSSLESDDATASSSSTSLLDMDSDTDDEEGGITLLGLDQALG